MATQENEVPISEPETVQELKYLGFVRSLVTLLFSWALKLYNFVEQRSGPFKILFDSLEKAEAAVLRPVLSKLASIGDGLLVFIDNRLVKAVEIYEVLVPKPLQTAIAEFTTLLKSAKTEAIGFSESVAKVSKTLVEKLKKVGIWGVISYIVQQAYQFLASLYSKLLQIIISKITELLLQSLKIPSVQTLVSTLVPLATSAIEKYSAQLTTVLGEVASSAQAASAVSSAANVATDVAEAAAATTAGIVGGVTDTLTEAVSALKG